MTTDEKALYDAIWESPHDDTPRLVYADWLEEHGHPERAEFIRVQCELARMDEDDPRRPEFERREQALWKKHAKAWRAGLPRPLNRGQFGRGFLSPPTRGIRGRQFLALTEADLAPAPLWAFHIEQATKLWPAIAECPNLRRVGHLDLGGNLLGPDAAARVLASPHLLNVATLRLWLGRFGDAGVAALADNAALAHLAEVDFNSCELTDDQAGRFIDSPRMATVRRLNLSSNRLTGEAARRIAASPHAGRLETLNLFANGVGDDGVRALARSGLRLQVLVLQTVGMTDASAPDLASWPGLATLRHLSLSTNRLTFRAARELAASPHLRDDVHLFLWHTPLELDREAVRLLRDRFDDRVSFYHAAR